ncbi:MAG: DUF4065 domain-containing protein [Deltaproteobacteria bacterium]|jgi:uncharacterized phage-associated protein|nr:DUF4065 domain-containing protein [Deltaproteobacteria bacterium]
MTDVTAPFPVINSAIAVANWFIGQNQIDQSDLTHLKLQKMLYFAQGWYLAYRDVPLFEDPIEAWKYGPVVRSVYRALNGRPKSEILTDLIEGYVLHGTDYSDWGTPKMSSCDDTEDFMRYIWNNYSKMEAWRLVSISHARNSPWDKVANSPGNRAAATENEWYGEYYDLVIPVELMRSYFRWLLERPKES